MHQKFYLFCAVNSWMLLLTVQGQAGEMPTICYNSSLEGKILRYFDDLRMLVPRSFLQKACRPAGFHRGQVKGR